MTANAFMLLAASAAAVLMLAPLPTRPVEIYRQRNPDHSTSYLELERVGDSAKIVRVYRLDNESDAHPEPAGVYFIRTTRDGVASEITLTHGPIAPSETLPIVNSTALAYRHPETPR
jgi:hypothetical protein